MATTAASPQTSKPAAPPTFLADTSTAAGTDTVVGTGIRNGSAPRIPALGLTDAVNGFGVLQHTGPPVQDDVPGLYRDGRVRNPVPSKLKGKTDARKGNFGVMHIDLTTTNEIRERDAAAKRTSEGTQLAARLAQTDRYIPIRRSKFVYRPEGQASNSPPQFDAPPQLNALQLNAVRETVWKTARGRASPLTAAETIAERARLLTLLRSLHPDLVVDQLCKALNFFGGIANEHTSPGGSFPVSAEANGPGSLFVGWLAEIFPALGQESIPSARQANLRRPRGRPKGSRNAKGKQVDLVGQRLASGARAAEIASDNSAGDDMVERFAMDDSWVDIDDTVADTDRDASQGDIERVVTTPVSSRAVCGPGAPGGMPGSGSVQTPTITPTPKRRGRPKGSKNRPKDKTPLTHDTHEKTNDAFESTTTGLSVQRMAVDPPGSSSMSVHLSTSAGPSELGVPLVKKRKGGPGRPKGSKNRPKEPAPVPGSQSHPTSSVLTANDKRDGPQSAALGASAQPPSVAFSVSPTRDLQHEQRPGTQISLASRLVSETASESAAIKPQASEVSTVAMRKRKASQEGKISSSNNDPLIAASPSSPNPAGGLTAITSENLPSPQVTRSQGSQGQDGTLTHQPVTKRQKVYKEPHQDVPTNSRMTQASHNSQTGQQGQRGPQSTEPTRVDLRNGSLMDADNSNLQRSRNHITASTNRSPLHLNSQQAQSDPLLGYSQSLRTSPAGREAERIETTDSYSLNVSSRHGMYNQDGPAQGQQQQRLFRQQEQHQPASRNLPNGSQHRLSSSVTGQIPPTLDQNGDNYTASTRDGEYHGLVGVQPPAYSTHMTVSATMREDNYRTSTSRPLQHQNSTFHARQDHPTQNTGMSSFQDYPDSAFLDMAGLDTASQTSLTVNPTQYNVNDAEMQRASPNMNPTYGSSSLGQSSFDGGMTESAMRERMYHTLRRH
ncbi:hypothetical protein CORC01_00189 [Colletotrichum orchidophilum]|uniref:Uncharacterized protein n=1 Tax=Colletotrichum orchidophilum TaxID=1209926 RepID=A0A1G4BST8_9PEZI|nr:uncharacterized protein CORC01_00189 [Colletotrichum orchidophilum]OHF04337.1 hypothetical protein CORC01_00189 [Colletotrichum orchidophilum]